VSSIRYPDAFDLARLGWFTQPTAGKILLDDDDGLAFLPSRDDVELRRRELMYPDEAGCSLALRESGLIAIDIDAHKQGFETAEVALRGPMPPHPICSTPRGGRHLIFQAPVCSTIAAKTNALGPGIDTLTLRCVIPPTKGYAWIVSPLEVRAPPTPLWLWKILPKLKPAGRSRARRRIRFTICELLPHLDRVRPRRSRGGGWTARCPSHDDKTPSFWIREGDDGQPFVGCSVCTSAELLATCERLTRRRDEP
jgi:hypothetical protein